MLDMRFERRSGLVGASSSDSPLTVAPSPSSSCCCWWCFDGSTASLGGSGDSEEPSVLPLGGRAGCRLATFRFVKDLTEVVSTASSKVSYRAINTYKYT